MKGNGIPSYAMRAACILALAFHSGFVQELSAAVIAKWTFESSAPEAQNQATIDGIAAEEGTGTASGFHTSSGTDWSNFAGNGTDESFSANNWAIGDYYQFTASTLGYSGIMVNWEQTRSSTGPSGFKLVYSTDGSTYLDFANNGYTVNQIDWVSGNYKSGSAFSFDLSGINQLNNAGSVYFRLVDTVAPGGSSGNARIDDFTITAAVPEPAEWGLISAGGLLAVAGHRAWRRARKIATSAYA